jgi:hypothetical protein
MSILVRSWPSVNCLANDLVETFDMLKTSVRIAWTEPKLIPSLLLCRSRCMPHMTRSCTALAVLSLVTSFDRPNRSSSPMLSLTLLNLATHLSQCFGKGTPSRLYPWSFHRFPWGLFLYYMLFMMTPISIFCIWS